MRQPQRSLPLSEYEELDDDERAPLPDEKPNAEDMFAAQCRVYRLPEVERQHTFAKATHQRLWKFDFCWRAYMVAVEIEGIVPRRLPSGLLVMAGRHGSVKGVIEDMEKYNTAAILGWSILRFPPKYVKPRRAIERTMQLLAAHGWSAPE